MLLFPRARSEAEWRTLREVMTANLRANEQRGQDAAGIVVIQRDGRYTLFKQPLTVSALVQLDGYHATLACMDENTVAVLGHTRMPTKGSCSCPANNHPIHAGHVLGVHNGVIMNDDALFNTLHLPRNGEVDSEIIFRLQDRVDPTTANGTYLARVRAELCRLEGRFATLSVDLRAPTRLLVLKHLQPLCLHYEAPLAALFFSSRYVFLRNAFGRAVTTEILEDDHAFTFEALELPARAHRPVETAVLCREAPSL